MTRKGDTDLFFNYGVDFSNRIIYIGDDISPRTVGHAIKGLTQCLIASKKRINVIMNNCGGDEYEGLALYDFIKGHSKNVTITVYGQAMSMASWVLQAAERRFLAPNATLLLHYGSCGFEGTTKDMEKLGEEIKRVNELMEDCYLERIHEVKPRFTRAQLQDLIKYDKYLSAKEAIELGLADGYIR